MHCAHVKLPDGNVAIVCTSHRSRLHRCVKCGVAAGLQCDWKVAPGKTCDAWICAGCAQEVGPDKHLCPTHQRSYKQWQAQRAASPLTPHASPVSK